MLIFVTNYFKNFEMGCFPSRKISAAERLTVESFINYHQEVFWPEVYSDDEVELKTWIPSTLRLRANKTKLTAYCFGLLFNFLKSLLQVR